MRLTANQYSGPVSQSNNQIHSHQLLPQEPANSVAAPPPPLRPLPPDVPGRLALGGSLADLIASYIQPRNHWCVSVPCEQQLGVGPGGAVALLLLLLHICPGVAGRLFRRPNRSSEHHTSAQRSQITAAAARAPFYNLDSHTW